MKGLILFAHGARDPQWAAPFLRLQQIIAVRHTDCQVALAYLELMSPSLPAAVSGMASQGVDTIQVAPLFLGPGAHFRQDFPALMNSLRAQFPQLNLISLPVLGESETLLYAIADWITSVSAPR